MMCLSYPCQRRVMFVCVSVGITHENDVAHGDCFVNTNALVAPIGAHTHRKLAVTPERITRQIRAVQVGDVFRWMCILLNWILYVCAHAGELYVLTGLLFSIYNLAEIQSYVC